MKLFLGVVVVLTIFSTADLQSEKCTSTINGKAVDENIIYDEYTPFDGYESITEYNDRGMGPFFKMVDGFIHALMPETLPEGIIVDGTALTIKDGDYLALAQHYVGFLVFIACLLLFAIVMPVFGCCFGCCRCCGNCGAQIQKDGENNDSCCKMTGGFLLFTFFVLLLFGIVCAFTTNQQIDDGAFEYADNLKAGMKDMENYVKDVSNHSEILVVTNLGQFSTKITASLDETATTVFEEVKEVTGAVSIDKAVVVAKNVDNMKKSMLKLEKHTANIRINGMQFFDGMWKVKQDLIVACDIPMFCNDLINVIEEINTDFNFDEFPDISEYTTNLGTIDSLEDIVNKGKENLEEIETEINDKIGDNVNKVKEQIREAESTLKGEWSTLSARLDEVLEDVANVGNGPLDTVDQFLKTYSPYRYYVGLAFTFLLLVVALCLLMGLVCGTCGRMASDENDGGCCSKGTGGTFLMCGVGLMTISAFFLVCVVLLHIIGILPALLICEPLRAPSDSDIVPLLEDYIKFENYFGVGLGDVLKNCEQDKSVYEVFNLEAKFNLSDVENFIDSPEGKEIVGKIDEFINKIEQQFIDGLNVVLLTEDMESNINSLINYGLSDIELDKFLEPLDEVDKISLKELIKKLDDIINEIPSPTKEKLMIINTQLRQYDTHLLMSLIKDVNDIKTEVEVIQETLKTEDETFEDSLRALLDEITEAQNTLNDPSTVTLVMKILEEFKDQILTYVTGYTERVAKAFRCNVGTCGPLDKVIKGIVTSTCDKIVSPMNGFWFSIFWCILFFIPIIIMSVRMTTIYRKVRAEPLYGEHIVDNYYY